MSARVHHFSSVTKYQLKQNAHFLSILQSYNPTMLPISKCENKCNLLHPSVLYLPLVCGGSLRRAVQALMARAAVNLLLQGDGEAFSDDDSDLWFCQTDGQTDRLDLSSELSTFFHFTKPQKDKTFSNSLKVYTPLLRWTMI